jgi:hypothetical protein
MCFNHLYQLNQIDQNNDRLYIQINHMILLNYRQSEDQSQLNSKRIKKLLRFRFEMNQEFKAESYGAKNLGFY